MEGSVPRVEHDEAVRMYALHLLSIGYEVHARIDGWFQAPDYIYGYRPDIVARRGNEWLVVEIMKGDTDWPKISALERIERERADYKVVIASPQDVKMRRWAGANDR